MNRLESLARRSLGVFLVLAVSGLAACGGGGGGCSGGEDVSASISYPDAFSVRQPEKGVQIAAQSPRTSGVPQSCMSDRRFSLEFGQLPAGVSLDSRTGVISGTPTETGYYLFGVKLTLDDLKGSVNTAISMRVMDSAAQTIATWDSGQQVPGNGRLNSLAGHLWFLGSTVWGDGDEGRFVAMSSSDAGDTWVRQSPANPPLLTRGFATSEAGSELLVSGGELNGMGRSVWAFDGSKWATRTSSAAFPARRDHVMFNVGSSVYLTGGSNGTGNLRDLWRSTDGGRTWSQLDAGFATQDRRPVCGFALNGRVVIVTVIDSPVPGMDGLTEVWSSATGSDWQLHRTAENSPLRALPTSTSQCVVGNGRAYLFGDYDTVSTTDLEHWAFEPQMYSNSSPDIGGTFMDGRLFVVSGVETSTHYFYRSTPR
jgi:hypothetical protein